MMRRYIFVDSINGDKARVLYGEKEFILPAALLPKGTKGGEYFLVSFKKDAKKTDKAKREIDGLLNELGNSCEEF